MAGRGRRGGGSGRAAAGTGARAGRSPAPAARARGTAGRARPRARTRAARGRRRRGSVEIGGLGVALGDQLVHALGHLGRGLLGEREGEDLLGPRALRRDQVRDAAREHGRLAGAGAGDDEERPLAVDDRLALGLVEALEDALLGGRQDRPGDRCSRRDSSGRPAAAGPSRAAASRAQRVAASSAASSASGRKLSTSRALENVTVPPGVDHEHAAREGGERGLGLAVESVERGLVRDLQLAPAQRRVLGALRAGCAPRGG